MTLTVEAKAPPLRADENGVMRVGNTRVTLDSIVRAFQEGHTAEEITSHFPSLKLADVYATISYYLDNRTAVDRYIEQQEHAAGDVWEDIGANSDYKLFRERLLAATGKTSQ